MTNDAKELAAEIHGMSSEASQVAVQALLPVLDRLIHELIKSGSIPETFIADALDDVNNRAEDNDERFPNIHNPARLIADWLAGPRADSS